MHTSEQTSNPDYQNSDRSTSTRPTLQLLKQYGLKIKKNCVQYNVCLFVCQFQYNCNASAFRPPEPNLRSQYSLLNSSPPKLLYSRTSDAHLTLCGGFDKKPALCGFFWGVPTLSQKCSKKLAGRTKINGKNI